MELPPELQKPMEIFFPVLAESSVPLLAGKLRFVHYTNAETAMEIIRNREVWMRNSNIMNDFSEIEYGMVCLNEAYKSDTGTEFKRILEAEFPGIIDPLQDTFNGWLEHFRANTYVTCLSEHRDDEDSYGRLSMWRAYGGANGIALVVNGTPFAANTQQLKAFSSPISYLNREQFREKFAVVVENLRNNIEYIRNLGKEQVFGYVFSMFRFAVMCTKHPGFNEEKEWRIIYSPTMELSPKITEDVKIIGGVPQVIYKIPLEDDPENGLVGAAIPSLVNRIIIGPTRFPATLRQAFVKALAEAGVNNPEAKVWVSDIPLRQ